MVISALIGGSLPTIRSRPDQAPAGEKTTPNFFFQVIHPDALNCGAFAAGRDQAANVKAVIDDVMGHGNRDTGRCILPGQIEHAAAVRSHEADGLLFTESEAGEFDQLAKDTGVEFDLALLATVQWWVPIPAPTIWPQPLDESRPTQLAQRRVHGDR